MDSFIFRGFVRIFLSLRHTQDLRYLLSSCSEDSSSESSYSIERLVFTFPANPVFSTRNPDFQGQLKGPITTHLLGPLSYPRELPSKDCMMLVAQILLTKSTSGYVSA